MVTGVILKKAPSGSKSLCHYFWQSEREHGSIRRVGSGTNAIGHSDSTVSISSQRKPGKLWQQAFDALQALQMTDSVLRHGASPPVDSGELRIRPEADDLLKLFANDADYFFIGGLQNLFVPCATDEAAEQGAVLRCPVGKLVMHKRGGKHAFAFAARNQKTETGGQSGTHAPVVAEVYSDGRGVLYALKFGSEIFADRT